MPPAVVENNSKGEVLLLELSGKVGDECVVNPVVPASRVEASMLGDVEAVVNVIMVGEAIEFRSTLSVEDNRVEAIVAC